MLITCSYSITHSTNYIIYDTTCYELQRISTTCYELHRIDTTCYELHRIQYHMLRTTSYQNHMLQSFVPEHYWAPMNGTIAATCRPLAASCTSGDYLLLGTDEWTHGCNLPRSSDILHLRRLPISRHRWMDYLVYFAALRWQFALPAYTDIG